MALTNIIKPVLKHLKEKFLFLFLLSCISLCAQTEKSYGPVPSARQLQWSNMEFYLFVHFGPNTFTDLEWGKGTEPEDMFNPAQLDCRQWCRIAKAAGAKGIIITAKHHDGFCLWPSKYSAHTVAQSKWRNGKGDVLKELSEACKEYGLKMGVYLSPWDRNHPAYGTPAYNDVFVNMMKEVVQNYGPFFEFWWDGANGEGPNGKRQVYDWNRFEQTMRTIAPNTVVFSDIGPDIRWVGNENGIAGDPNWNLLDTASFARGEGAPPTDTLNHGNENGKNWMPTECDVSIRPGWFYHGNEDEKVKTPEQLFQLYLKSVGRGASLLLNVPPDRRGMINEHDSTALAEFKKIRDESFGNNLLANKKVTIINRGKTNYTSALTDHDDKTFGKLPGEKTVHTRYDMQVKFSKATKINCIVIKENIEKGQRIKKLRIVLLKNQRVIKDIEINTVGRKRIVTFPAEEPDSFLLIAEDAKATPIINEAEAYLVDEKLIEK